MFVPVYVPHGTLYMSCCTNSEALYGLMRRNIFLTINRLDGMNQHLVSAQAEFQFGTLNQ